MNKSVAIYKNATGFDNVRGYIIIFIGIPLGASLGLLTVKMVKNDFNVGSKNTITLSINALLYFTSGLIGSAGGFIVCNLLSDIIKIEWLNILGIFIGGVLGILLVKEIRKLEWRN